MNHLGKLGQERVQSLSRGRNARNTKLIYLKRNPRGLILKLSPACYGCDLIILDIVFKVGNPPVYSQLREVSIAHILLLIMPWNDSMYKNQVFLNFELWLIYLIWRFRLTGEIDWNWSQRLHMKAGWVCTFFLIHVASAEFLWVQMQGHGCMCLVSCLYTPFYFCSLKI